MGNVNVGDKVQAYWVDAVSPSMNGWYDATVVRIIGVTHCSVIFDQYPQWGEYKADSSRLRKRNFSSGVGGFVAPVRPSYAAPPAYVAPARPVYTAPVVQPAMNPAYVSPAPVVGAGMYAIGQ